MSLRRTVGAVGALLTCPCHAPPAVLLALLALFALSLWLLFRPGPVAAGVVAGPPGPGGTGGATPWEACGETVPVTR